MRGTDPWLRDKDERNGRLGHGNTEARLANGASHGVRGSQVYRNARRRFRDQPHGFIYVAVPTLPLWTIRTHDQGLVVAEPQMNAEIVGTATLASAAIRAKEPAHA